MACKINKPFFRMLQSKVGHMRVVQVEANEKMQSQLCHVRTLPLYDIVEPTPDWVSTSPLSPPYGAHTRLVRSIRNDEREALNDYVGFNVLG